MKTIILQNLISTVYNMLASKLAKDNIGAIIGAVVVGAIFIAAMIFSFLHRAKMSDKYDKRLRQHIAKHDKTLYMSPEDMQEDVEDIVDEEYSVDNIGKELDGIEEDKMHEPVFFNARLKGKYISTNHEGHYISKYNVAFVLVFEDEFGKEIEYSVNKPFFDSLSIGDEGTVMTINDRFFDFSNNSKITKESDYMQE